MRTKLLALVGLLLVGGAGLFEARFALVLTVGESMQPTLADGELMLVDRGAYRDTGPARGDIVVARHFGELIVKRVVGLPGETVAVQNGRLLIQGVRRQEDYSRWPGSLRIAPGTLGADRYALLGDNRSLTDGQMIHAVTPRDHLVGRVVAGLRIRSSVLGLTGSGGD